MSPSTTTTTNTTDVREDSAPTVEMANGSVVAVAVAVAVDDNNSVDHRAVIFSSSCSNQNNVDASSSVLLTSSSETTETTATTRVTIAIPSSEPYYPSSTEIRNADAVLMVMEMEPNINAGKQHSVNDHHNGLEAGGIQSSSVNHDNDDNDNGDNDDDNDDCQDKKKEATKNNPVKANGQSDERDTTVASTRVTSPYYKSNESSDDDPFSKDLVGLGESQVWEEKQRNINESNTEFQSLKAATIPLDDPKVNDLIKALHPTSTQKQSHASNFSPSAFTSGQQQNFPGAHHTAPATTATATAESDWAGIPPPRPLPTNTTAAQRHRGPGAFAVFNGRAGDGGDEDDGRTITYGDGNSTTNDPNCTHAESSNNNNNAVMAVSASLAPAERRHHNRRRYNQQQHHQRAMTGPQVVNPTGDIIVTADADTSVSENRIEDPEYIKMQRKRQFLAGCSIMVLLLVVVLLSLGVAGIFGNAGNNNQSKNNNASLTQSGSIRPSDDSGLAFINMNTETTSAQTTTSPTFSPTLAKIQADGILNCAYNYLPGIIYPDDETGEITGINALMCDAIGAAIFGPNTPSGFSLQNVYYTVEDHFGTKFDDKYKAFNETYPRIEWVDFNPFNTGMMGTGQVFTGLAHNMERHVREIYVKLGFSFSSPFLFYGGYISGIPHFLECVDNKQFKHTEECSGLSICVQKSSSYEAFLREKLPERLLHFQLGGYMETLASFANGTCTLAMYGESEKKALEILNQLGYNGEFQQSKMLYSKEPIAMGTLKGDPVWDDFVNSVVQSLLVAEQHNITQATAHLFPQTNVFGEEYKDMFRNAISAVGNFGELYEYSMAQFFPRASQNEINNGNAPLLYSPPLGRLEQLDDFPLGPRLQSVLERGRLLCGVRPDHHGFFVQDDTDPTLLKGMDIDFCCAIASSLFGGDVDAVDYILLSSESSDGYIKLANEVVDVIAGATWNFVNDVREPATGLGFAFSLPYFYGYSEEEDNLCLATMQDDQDWSTYVYWIVASTIYAEERGVAQSNSNAMPIIYGFGSGLQRMFRDVIDAVGNYGEIYNRNLEEVIPRSSNPRNHLNYEPNFGPQLYPMPGLVP